MTRSTCGLKQVEGLLELKTAMKLRPTFRRVISFSSEQCLAYVVDNRIRIEC